MLKATHRKTDPAAKITYDQKLIDKFISHLKFKLTDSQSKVVSEILDDMKRPLEMNRLLQGDVGSGKPSFRQLPS